MDWKLIDTHRKSAREVSFRILVWGPSSNDSDGYNLRLCIKKHLFSKGHSAKFSEELIKEGSVAAAPDIITDEIFHADAANLIVVLYGSRGTQTEVDIILEFEEFSRKSVIVLDEQTWERIKHSLSCAKWQNFGAKLLILPSDKWNRDDICSKLDEVIETFQFSEYIRNLKLRLIRNDQ